MTETATSQKLIRFGVFEVDLRAGELRRQGFRIKLQEQPCQILGILLEHPGELVTREQLRNRLWASDTFVDFDHSLNTAVMRLREALGDSRDNPRFIETLPRKGYRFIAPVNQVAEPGSEPAPPSSVGPSDMSAILRGAARDPRAFGELAASKPRYKGFHPKRVAALIVFGATAAALLLSLSWLRTHKLLVSKVEAGHIESLLVLPLDNLSGDKEQEYFADGMTDELTASLAKIQALRVISRTSAMAYKGTRKPLGRIARELNVDAVVEGTVLRSGNRVRITAKLIQASTDQHLWAETYESDVGNILALQSRVARAIADEIRVKITPEEQVRLGKNRAVKAGAYEDYLKGRYYWNKRTQEGMNKAIEYFQEAIVKDPQYALAYAGMADCYGVMGAAIVGAVPSKEAAPKAEAAALKALAIDNTLPEAQTSLATMRFNYDWDWPAAEGGFKRALQLDPRYATAHQRYSLYLMAVGRTQESVAEISRARELDPLSLSINFSLGWRLYMARQYDQAIQQLRNTIEMNPDFALAHRALGQAYGQKNAHAQAISELQKATTLSHRSPLMLAALGRAYAAAGNRTQAHEVLNELRAQSKRQYVSPFYMAVVYAGLGETDRTMEWLEKAFEDRSNGLVFIKVDPEFDSMRAHPRFQDLLHRIGLPL